MLASDIIRRVKEIQIRTGRQVADVLAGEYVSVFKGSGVEFEEVRPYVVGDDVRSIDWNVTARAGAPFVKRYVEERQLTLMLMADVSASQDFGSGTRTKREATAELCALLAFCATRNDDKVGLALFHGAIETYIPPRKGHRHAQRVVREVLAHSAERNDDSGAPTNLENLDRKATSPLSGRGLSKFFQALVSRRTQRLRPAKQSTDIAGAMAFLLSVTKRRTVCFVVSDFIDDDFERALSMANRRHDVVAVLVTDPREFDVPQVGLISLRDAETNVSRVYDTSSKAFCDALAEAAQKRVHDLEQRLRRRGIDFIHVDISNDTVEPLVAFFRMRGRRTRR
ncbi:MAG: hypothetical protein ACI8PT_000432 [Gammaproteobacteria bacterium]|jgi:uncharacterized protein (DUF58 family)